MKGKKYVFRLGMLAMICIVWNYLEGNTNAILLDGFGFIIGTTVIKYFNE